MTLKPQEHSQAEGEGMEKKKYPIQMQTRGEQV